MKAMVHSVSEVNSFQEAWLRLGMDVPTDDYELTQRIGNFLTHLVAHAGNWSEREVAPSTIKVPSFEEEPSASSSAPSAATAEVPKRSLADMKKERQAQLQLEIENHKGYSGFISFLYSNFI
jgi:hypothetical protein